MCTTSVYACKLWHVFRRSYLQRFHTLGPYTNRILMLQASSLNLTDSQVASWWSSVGSQFAFLNEDLRHKGTDANIFLCFSQKSIDSPTFLLHWNPSQDIQGCLAGLLRGPLCFSTENCSSYKTLAGLLQELEPLQKPCRTGTKQKPITSVTELCKKKKQ